MQHEPFRLIRPKTRTTSVVFSSPHSGREYPLAFLRRSILDEVAVRSSEDAFVDLLFSDAPTMGAPLLAANAPRAYVDLNRSAEDLDPALIEGVPKKGHNPRISSGLGVIPRVVSGGRMIYRGKITRIEAEGRLRAHWEPYHEQLHALLMESHAAFGEAVLIDCHSMPNEAASSVRKGGGVPDVVLGDRYGASAHPDVMERVEAAFAATGLRVQRNTPFAGAYITQHYGRPSRRQHAIQIEINRALYMDEAKVRPSPRFDDFKRVIARVIGELVEIGGEARSLAAE